MLNKIIKFSLNNRLVVLVSAVLLMMARCLYRYKYGSRCFSRLECSDGRDNDRS